MSKGKDVERKMSKGKDVERKMSKGKDVERKMSKGKDVYRIRDFPSPVGIGCYQTILIVLYYIIFTV
jgi:hypothetical protein